MRIKAAGVLLILTLFTPSHQLRFFLTGKHSVVANFINMANVDIHPSPALPYEKHTRPDEHDPERELSNRHMSVGKYAATRFSTLKPPMAKAPNPFKLLAMLNTQQWLFFLVAFLAWSWDAFDFFTVSLTVTDLAEDFGKTNTDITWGITLVLMFRSIGSTIFGMF